MSALLPKPRPVPATALWVDQALGILSVALL